MLFLRFKAIKMVFKSILQLSNTHQSEPVSVPQKNQLTARQMHDLEQVLDINKPDKLNLLTYLVCRMNPSTDIFRDKLCSYIHQDKLMTNSDIERALKNLKKQAQNGYTPTTLNWVEFEQEFFGECRRKELLQEIETLVSQSPVNFSNTNYCKHTIRLLTAQFPSIPSREIFNAFNEIKQSFCSSIKQSFCPTNEGEIYDKISRFDARDLASAINTKSQIDEHLAITHGKVWLRFPPEPNGYLHLGHVRSIWLNFYSASKLEGRCYLRYDDTNPTNESKEYIDVIKQNVEWFGYDTSHITYASDYFGKIYDCAVTLIQQDKAYICEQNKQEINSFRKNKQASPYRQRSTEESLILFSQMRDGQHDESKYTLRLKIDPQHSNPTLRDPIIYRVKFHAHPKTGDAWKIYPMYDFAHCICDSLENITHSLCTLEFEIRRELYYWILSQLEMFKPIVYEFSRLNVSHNLLSKRKIQQLVQSGSVVGWDDPRLLTLAGLKRRGYTASALIAFIQLVNVSRSGNENIIQMSQLEACMRKELDDAAPRLMVVLDPIRLELTNLPIELEGTKLSLTLHPKLLELGEREITIQKHIYIDRSDFRILDDPDYYGLAPHKEVVLKYFASIICDEYVQDEKGQVTTIKARIISYSQEDRKKIKGQLHWLSQQDAMDSEVREYSSLFTIDNPAEHENYLDYINVDSLSIKQAKIPRIFDYHKYPRLQFERLGFYFLDTTPQMMVFNKIVGLKDKEKKKSFK